MTPRDLFFNCIRQAKVGVNPADYDLVVKGNATEHKDVCDIEQIEVDHERRLVIIYEDA